MSAILNALAGASDAVYALGVALFTLSLVVLIWALIGQKGNVTIGPDPVIPRPLSDATTVILPREPIAPNYVRSDKYRSDLADWFPLADTADLTGPLAAVAAYFERTETITRTVTEVRITIPARHRREDVHSETVPITREQLVRVRAAKELTR